MVDTSKLQSPGDIFALIRTHIEVHKTRITNEIRSYPMPIPACDAQYNFLLEERGRINRELQQLQAWSGDPRFSTTPPETLRAFIDACSYIDPELRQELAVILDRAS